MTPGASVIPTPVVVVGRRQPCLRNERQRLPQQLSRLVVRKRRKVNQQTRRRGTLAEATDSNVETGVELLSRSRRLGRNDEEHGPLIGGYRCDLVTAKSVVGAVGVGFLSDIWQFQGKLTKPGRRHLGSIAGPGVAPPSSRPERSRQYCSPCIRDAPWHRHRPGSRRAPAGIARRPIGVMLTMRSTAIPIEDAVAGPGGWFRPLRGTGELLHAAGPGPRLVALTEGTKRCRRPEQYAAGASSDDVEVAAAAERPECVALPPLRSLAVGANGDSAVRDAQRRPAQASRVCRQHRRSRDPPLRGVTGLVPSR